jgi:HK97 family phage major capsid protein
MAPQLSDFSGVVPIEFSAQIIEEAVNASAALTLGQRLPMGTRISSLPVPTAFPTASWVSSAGGRKGYTNLILEPQVVTAEEVAAVVAVPDAYFEDNTINLWNFIRPRMAEAIAVAVDQAVFFGGGPVTFPTGGLIANTWSTLVPAVGPLDPVDGVNAAMGQVEGRGLAVSGHSADLAVKAALRGIRDANNSLLLGEERAVGERMVPTLYGAPIQYSSYPGSPAVDFFTGAWQYLIMGVRQDIRFAIEPAGVIASDTGSVLVSGFQDNVTPMKVWARFGCAVVRPYTTRAPVGPKIPFSRAKLVGMGPPPADGAADEGTGRAAKK